MLYFYIQDGVDSRGCLGCTALSLRERDSAVMGIIVIDLR